MQFENLTLYFDKINSLKKDNNNFFSIFLGIEGDYIENISDFELFKKFNIDYIIGGVHYLNQKLSD